MSRRSRRRRTRPVLAIGAVGLLVVLGVAMLTAWGQPRLVWRLQTADNRLQLHLRVGGGPLAGWVLGATGLELPGMRHPVGGATQQLASGERVRERVVLVGLERRVVTVMLRVPPAPTLRRRRLAPLALELRFDLRLERARAAAPHGRAGLVAARGQAVLLARTARLQVVRLEVTALDGEETQLAVTVPALPEIGWTAGPPRLTGRTPLWIRFAQAIRWAPGGPGLRLTPAVAGTWRAVGPATLRFVPRRPWPGPGGLRVQLPALADLAGTGGALVAAGTASVRLAPVGRPALGRHRPAPGPARPAPPAGTGLPVYAFGKPSGGRIYITIDDGWFPSVGVLRMMRRGRLPITAFLIADAVQENIPYWRAFVAAGGVIEDHTVSHPDLNTLTPHGSFLQWAVNRVRIQRWLGTAPTLGRPPYGDADPTVLAAARSAGLRGIVLWSVTDQGGQIQTWDGRPLEAGEIVLLHWDPGLAAELHQLLQVIRSRHLTPAPLLAGLP